MKGCGKKFEFTEADSVYVEFCQEGDLCPKCEKTASKDEEKK